MSTDAMTTSNGHSGAVCEQRGYQRLPVPELRYEQERWSTTRSENVAKIAETWRENPNLVRVFRDPKFGRMQMAMLRKDQLEALLKVINDLQSGQAAVQLDTEALVQAVSVVQHLARKQASRGDDEGEALANAVSVMAKLWGRISSSILVRVPTRKVTPSPLSEEEQEPLED